MLVVAIYRQARTDQARPAQAIVVLGTAQYNGWPGPVFQARLDRALELWREGYAPVLVVTGGKMPGDGYTEAEAAWTYLTDAGVPAEAIVTENAASDTWESMQGIAALLQPLEIDEVIVVSDGFHLFRSRHDGARRRAAGVGIAGRDEPDPHRRWRRAHLRPAGGCRGRGPSLADSRRSTRWLQYDAT